ncbi:hypothetical protein [Fuchsiella alkaliacetigena]|nr:hypothetical protein [Fuchsiella alkaliacetigena]MCK8823580.1 hypothetical protein [Fuchsiella alkaliacetigena]
MKKFFRLVVIIALLIFIGSRFFEIEVEDIIRQIGIIIENIGIMIREAV